jgi:hypothetical protein
MSGPDNGNYAIYQALCAQRDRCKPSARFASQHFAPRTAPRQPWPIANPTATTARAWRGTQVLTEPYQLR